MARTPRKTKESHGRWRHAAAILITLLIIGGLLLGIDRLGSEALRGIGPRSRYRVAFADVHCAAPPGLGRQTFLTEVRYVARFPETFNALDESDREKVAAAFALHPWVESVEGVSVEPGNAVNVHLVFRVPVLAVHTESGEVRLIDARGTLLPYAAIPPQLSELIGTVPPPAAAAGHVWDDPIVKRALELVAAHHPKSLEKTATDWRLVMPDGRVLHAAW
jgi:hypothetical protein